MAKNFDRLDSLEDWRAGPRQIEFPGPVVEHQRFRRCALAVKNFQVNVVCLLAKNALHQVIQAKRRIDPADDAGAAFGQSVSWLAIAVHRHIHQKAGLYLLPDFLHQSHFA